MKISCILIPLAIASSMAPAAPVVSDAAKKPPGMIWIPGGNFTMGNALDGGRQDEKPVVKVTIDGFWIDACAVTNAEFRKFVTATQYKTVAERPIDWEEVKKQLEPGTPKPPDEQLQPGSVTFAPPEKPADPQTQGKLVDVDPRCQLATPRRARQRPHRARRPPGHSHGVGRCRGLRKMG